MQTKKYKKPKSCLFIFAVFIVLLILTSCGKKSPDYSSPLAAEKGLTNYELITYPGHPVVGDTQLFAHQFYYNYEDRIIFKDDEEYNTVKYIGKTYRMDKHDVIVDMGEKYGSDDECFYTMSLHLGKFLELEDILEIGRTYMPAYFNKDNYYLEYSLIKTDIYEDEESRYEYAMHYSKYEIEKDPNIRPKATEYDTYPRWIEVYTNTSYNDNYKFDFLRIRTSQAYFSKNYYVTNREGRNSNGDKEKIIEWHYDYFEE